MFVSVQTMLHGADAGQRSLTPYLGMLLATSCGLIPASPRWFDRAELLSWAWMAAPVAERFHASCAAWCACSCVFVCSHVWFCYRFVCRVVCMDHGVAVGCCEVAHLTPLSAVPVDKRSIAEAMAEADDGTFGRRVGADRAECEPFPSLL